MLYSNPELFVILPQDVSSKTWNHIWLKGSVTAVKTKHAIRWWNVLGAGTVTIQLFLAPQS